MNVEHKHTVKELWIFPIKSIGGMRVDSAMALPEGFQNDRRWMLIDENGQFVTQREHFNLSTFSSTIADNKLIISHNGDTIDTPLDQITPDPIRVQVWSSKLKAQEVSPDISNWFSTKLSMKVSLVKMTDISKRPKPLFVPPYKTTLSFADGYPYLILGEESMNELNSKLDQPVLADRFRANIITSSSIAHEEDEWKELNAGNAQLKVIKPCARCVMITVNQQTGETGKEPLKTLAGYREKRNKIYFGANAICTKDGMISVGDSLELM